jgi:hypothetical protein
MQCIGNDPDGGSVSRRPTCLSQPVNHVRMITRPHPGDAIAYINIERTWRRGDSPGQRLTGLRDVTELAEGGCEPAKRNPVGSAAQAEFAKLAAAVEEVLA